MQLIQDCISFYSHTPCTMLQNLHASSQLEIIESSNQHEKMLIKNLVSPLPLFPSASIITKHSFITIITMVNYF